VLLLGLPLDMIALPIPPGDTTLAYSGYLCFRGVLRPFAVLPAGYGGAIIGVTVTYWIGRRVGAPLVDRYGKWLFIKPAHLERTRMYYKRFGNALLLFSFFVPGIRQFAGYFVGILRIPYLTFAVYAYIGAVLWVTFFFGIGFVFGKEWQIILGWVERHFAFVAAGVAALVAFMIFRWSKSAKAVKGIK
jgi:membrane protein DedA with SNARE-associated domain